MRIAIYDYLYSIRASLKGLTVSDNLPWVDNSAALYLQNKKYVYVDLDQVSQEPLIETLGGNGTVDEITTVRVYFANDAKILLSNYEDLVALIKAARLTQDISGVINRLCQVSSEYVGDAVVTTFEFTFRKMQTNQ
jgi:hypothetical protein